MVFRALLFDTVEFPVYLGDANFQTRRSDMIPILKGIK